MQECHVFRVAAADDIQQVIQAHLLRHEYFCITVMNYLVPVQGPKPSIVEY